MKKTIILICLALFTIQGFSQSIDESTRKKFSIVFDVFNDFWVGVPDSIKNRFFNQGVNLSGLYDYRIGTSNFSVAFGAGIGAHNFYSNAATYTDTATNNTYLRPIKNVYPGNSYKKNKISFTYLDIPIEFRMRTKSEIRASVGFKVGLMIDSHTKYKGDNYLSNTPLYLAKDDLKIKVKDVRNIERFRYGVTARFGWKFINLTGFYSLTGLFKKGEGTEMYPISVGISLMPF